MNIWKDCVRNDNIKDEYEDEYGVTADREK